MTTSDDRFVGFAGIVDTAEGIREALGQRSDRVAAEVIDEIDIVRRG